MANADFAYRSREKSAPVLDYITNTVERMADVMPFSVDGNVTTAPNWFDPKFEHYFGGVSLKQYQPMAFSREERLAFLGVFTLIALAIIFRK